MTTLDEKIREQLSAWMDGELPADEARFLERRLANEPELRAQWERMQLASSCMKGQGLRLMPRSVATGVAAAISAPDAAATTRRPWLGWAVAASVAVLALVVVPNWTGDAVPASVPVATQPAAPGPTDPQGNPVLNATPASADLVASADSGAGSPVPATPASPIPAQDPPAAPVVASNVADAGQSPSDFRNRWLAQRVVPLHSLRFMLLSHWQPTLLPWPPRYLVSECTTMSAPCSNGRSR